MSENMGLQTSTQITILIFTSEQYNSSLFFNAKYFSTLPPFTNQAPNNIDASVVVFSAFGCLLR
jgi:hypothetical protein